MEPKKFISIENFVDESFEKLVSETLNKSGVSGRDRSIIARFGSSQPYPSFMISSQIPKFIADLKLPFDYDSASLSKYEEGDQIDWHIDLPSAGNRIMIISMLSDAHLKFRKDNEVISFLMPRFSLSIFSDSLRWEWEHSLKSLNERTSIVFRNSREKIIKWNSK